MADEIKSEEIKKTISTQEASAETPVTPEEIERRKKLAIVDDAVIKFNMYPIATNEEIKNASLATLKKIYSEGDEKINQIILYVLHEIILQYSEYRIPKNFEYFKKKFPQAQPSQLRMNVFKGMFNYSNSLEGLIEIINLLCEFDTNDSIKILTHHFSFFCAYDGSEGSRILRNVIIDALGKSRSVYALDALLSYVKNIEDEHLASRIICAIIEWKEKIGKLKIAVKKKNELMAKINEVIILEKEGGHYR
ncbi:MAG: hypothetical protein AB1391_03810 [Candidatus Micrarchaeota archaeon]